MKPVENQKKELYLTCFPFELFTLLRVPNPLTRVTLSTKVAPLQIMGGIFFRLFLGTRKNLIEILEYQNWSFSVIRD
jgi:hypothetical protein